MQYYCSIVLLFISYHSGYLTIMDFKVVREALCRILHKWHSLGIVLGCSPSELDAIAHYYRTPGRRLDEMLNLWLRRSNPRPSWEGLILALKEPIVGQEGLAFNISVKYGGK